MKRVPVLVWHSGKVRTLCVVWLFGYLQNVYDAIEILTKPLE
jgi:hypothetical protein